MADVDGKLALRIVQKYGSLGGRISKVPQLESGVWPLDEWLEVLAAIADNSWVFQGILDDRYLFTFSSTAADDRCYWEEFRQDIPLFSGRHKHWEGSVDCFEQVLTDKDFNVLAAFSEMRPPGPCLAQVVQTALYYDWVKLNDVEVPTLVPVCERISVKVDGQKESMYTSVFWTNYRKFRVEHEIDF